jgi:hypothetical protein
VTTKLAGRPSEKGSRGGGDAELRPSQPELARLPSSLGGELLRSPRARPAVHRRKGSRDGGDAELRPLQSAVRGNESIEISRLTGGRSWEGACRRTDLRKKKDDSTGALDVICRTDPTWTASLACHISKYGKSVASTDRMIFEEVPTTMMVKS